MRSPNRIAAASLAAALVTLGADAAYAERDLVAADADMGPLAVDVEIGEAGQAVQLGEAGRAGGSVPDDADRARVGLDAKAGDEDDDDELDDDDDREMDDEDDDDVEVEKDRPHPVFNDGHRTAVRKFLQQQNSECPANLVSTETGCAPAESERLWAVGKPLAESVVLTPVPAALMSELPKAEPGQAYGFVNGDIVLYRTDTRVVIDAVSWDS